MNEGFPEIRAFVEIEIEDFVIDSLEKVATLWKCMEALNKQLPEGYITYFPLTGDLDGET